jgi:hypothetical protein
MTRRNMNSPRILQSAKNEIPSSQRCARTKRRVKLMAQPLWGVMVPVRAAVLYQPLARWRLPDRVGPGEITRKGNGWAGARVCVENTTDSCT